MTSTIPTTLAEYQKFVREEAIRIKEEGYFTDEKLNVTLKALGLPEMRTFLIPVEVTGKMTVMLSIDDAQTEEQARASIATMDPDRLHAVASRASYSYMKAVSGEVLTVPETYAVGDPDLTLSNPSIYASIPDRANRRQCEQYQPSTSHYCTLRRGHEGDQHVGGNGTKIVAVWPTES